MSLHLRSFNWKLWVGLLLSALFMYLAFRKVDLARVWTLTESADPLLILLVILAIFFQYVVRVWRWRLLLEPIQNTGFLNRLSTLLIGFAANCVLPARLGEFIRANYLGHTEKISGSSVFGTIVVERLFDGLTLLLVLLIGLMGTTFPEQWHSLGESLKAAGWLILLLYLGLIIFLAGFKYKANTFLRIFERLMFFVPERYQKKAIETLWNFSRGLVLVKTPSRWFLVILFSFIVWFCNLFQIHWMVHSVGLRVPFIASFLVMAMASLGVMIPSAPGYIGTFHLSVQYALLVYGLGRDEALSVAILWHAALFLSTLFFGFLAFIYVQIRFGRPSEARGVLQSPAPQVTGETTD